MRSSTKGKGNANGRDGIGKDKTQQHKPYAQFVIENPSVGSAPKIPAICYRCNRPVKHWGSSSRTFPCFKDITKLLLESFQGLCRHCDNGLKTTIDSIKKKFTSGACVCGRMQCDRKSTSDSTMSCNNTTLCRTILTMRALSYRAGVVESIV